MKTYEKMTGFTEAFAKKNYAIVIVTHSMQQAARISQRTAFFHLGNLVEQGKTDDVFMSPQDERTQNYITGRIG